MLELYSCAVRTLHNAHLILVTLFVGLALKRVTDANLRKWTCTLVGIYVSSVLYRQHFWHYFLVANATVLAILASGPKKCHIICCAVAFGYISSFRIFNYETIAAEDFDVSLLMMLFVAKVTGVAFDVHFGQLTGLTFWDLFHFTFCHMELMSGFFYRYRTYDDYINTKFSINYKNYKYTFSRFVMAVTSLGLYLLMHGKYFPMEYMSSGRLVREESFWYSCWYGMMHGLASRIWMIYLFGLGEFVCSVSGFGAYPVRGASKQGHGPTKNYKSEAEVRAEEYDLRTVQNVRLEQLLTTPWVRDMIRAWNMTFQYWVGDMLQKSVKSHVRDHDLAFVITMAVDTVWHGVNPGFVVGCSMMVVYMFSMRSLWRFYNRRLCDTNSVTGTLYKACMWTVRECCCCFFSLCCMLYHSTDLLAYYSHVYYFPFVFVALLAVIALSVDKKFNR